MSGEDETAGPGADRPAVAPTGPEPAPVLVVEDDPKTLRFVRDALAASDYVPVVTKKLRTFGDDAARTAYIVNERGVGYRMARPGEND